MKLGQVINVAVSVGISLDDDLVGSGTFNHTCILSDNADTGVNGSLAFDTGTNSRSFCGNSGTA